MSDTTLRPGEIRAEVVQIQPARRQIEVRTDSNRTRILEYDPRDTRVLYHGREHGVEELQAGDVIAFNVRPRGNVDYVNTIRVQEPVQARAASGISRRAPVSARSEILDGRVESIDHERGIFELQQPNGTIVTVALPYNARPSDVAAFRQLRAGDLVRIEGAFVNRDNVQLLAFTR